MEIRKICSDRKYIERVKELKNLELISSKEKATGMFISINNKHYEPAWLDESDKPIIPQKLRGGKWLKAMDELSFYHYYQLHIYKSYNPPRLNKDLSKLTDSDSLIITRLRTEEVSLETELILRKRYPNFYAGHAPTLTDYVILNSLKTVTPNCAVVSSGIYDPNNQILSAVSLEQKVGHLDHKSLAAISKADSMFFLFKALATFSRDEFDKGRERMKKYYKKGIMFFDLKNNCLME